MRWKLPGPFVRLQLRHAAFVYVMVRVLATGAIAWSASMVADRSPVAFSGFFLALVIMLITAALMFIEQRRNGAPDLMANLAMSAGQRSLIAVLPALIGETLLMVCRV